MTYSMMCCRCWPQDIVSCSSCIVIHFSMLVVDYIALILSHIPVISLSVFVVILSGHPVFHE